MISMTTTEERYEIMRGFTNEWAQDFRLVRFADGSQAWQQWHNWDWVVCPCPAALLHQVTVTPSA